ncbi:MAG: ATPase [Verrucomicrobiae bacterium]|nr:ATPase [Verrucomicrobiae bacterium]
MKSSLQRNISMGLALFLISAFFTLHPKGAQFLSPQNLSNLSIELAITAILALGMLVVLLPGMIDLSVGSGAGMLGGIACVLVVSPQYLGLPGHGWPAFLALAAATLLALGLWAMMGALIIRYRVPAFIITLGGLLVFKGAHWAVIRNSTIPVAPGGTENFFSLLTTYYIPSWGGYLLLILVSAGLFFARRRRRWLRLRHGLPVDDPKVDFLKFFVMFQCLLLLVVVMNHYKGTPLPLVILGAVILAIQTITRNTRFGRYLYAIGGNEEAAVLSGINVQRVIIGAYLLLGGVVALTGFMQTAYGGYTTTTVGNLMELDAIAACVIGGTSLKGGRGTVSGVLFGALIMATLLNGMTLLAVTPEVKLIARGVVLVLAVWMDVRFSQTGK